MKRKPRLCDHCDAVVFLSHEEGVWVDEDTMYCEPCADKLEAYYMSKREEQE